MIQRIQSIWLLLASACAFLSLTFPFYDGTYAANNEYHQLTGMDDAKLMIATCLIGALALLTIFLFKSRKLQLRLCLMGILLDILLVILYFIETKDFNKGTYNLWALLPAAIAFLFFLAARSISKDEKLVKDSDRLR
jgi:peptidoglycan/LPS O-acetylase OafA/YrhL